MIFTYPKWIEKMPSGAMKDRAINRFVLRLCCVYAHPDCTIRKLAELLDMNQHTLKTQMQVVASDETKKAIRKKLGPEFVPPHPHNIQFGRRYK
jgi:hypothetical protein